MRGTLRGQALSVGGLLASALGLTVVFGWVTASDGPAQVAPWADPMPFNAALAFVLLGVGLLGTVAGWTRLARLASGLVLLYGIVAVAEHSTQGWISIGRWLFAPEGAGSTSLGRTAPNAALGFILLGTAALALTIRWSWLVALGTGLAAAAAMALALVDLLAWPFVAGSSAVPLLVPQLSLAAGAGLLLIGLALLVAAWSGADGLRALPGMRGPFAVGLAGVSVAMVLAHLLRYQERVQIRSTVEVAADAVARQVAEEVRRRLALGRTVAAAWPWVNSEGRAALAQSTLAVDPAARRLGWVPRAEPRRWVATSAAAGAPDDWWPPEDEGSVDRTVVTFMPGRLTGLLGIGTPVRNGGLVWLVSDLDLGLRIQLHEVLAQFAVAVRDGATPVFSHAAGAEGLEALWSREAAVPFGDQTWSVRVWPRPMTLAAARSTLPIFTQTGGMAVAILVAMVLSLARMARVRAREAEAAEARTLAESRDRETAQALLRESEERLRQAGKLEAVGRLAGGVAHDYNNILTVIRGNARSLLLQAQLAPLERDALEHIERAAARASVLTARLLAFSQRQVLQPEPVELRAFVVGRQDELRQLLGPHIKLIIDQGPGAAWTLIDPRWLGQVVLDLSYNAREAMPLGGQLTIRVRPDPSDLRQIYPALPGERSYVVLELCDSGAGIDLQVRSRLFEPFFSTKPFGQGSGLALASAYGLIRQSGGEIVVASQEGEGTRIGLFLPRESPEGPAPDDSVVLDGKVVLAADDEPGVLRFIARVLERAGCRVVAQPSAEAAWEAVENDGLRPDLLVTDIVMPGLSGVQLADRLRARWPDLPVLLVSAYTSDALRERGIASLEAHLLSKPFTVEELLAQAQRALARR